MIAQALHRLLSQSAWLCNVTSTTRHFISPLPSPLKMIDIKFFTYFYIFGVITVLLLESWKLTLSFQNTHIDTFTNEMQRYTGFVPNNSVVRRKWKIKLKQNFP